MTEKDLSRFVISSTGLSEDEKALSVGVFLKTAISVLVCAAHKTAVEHGWWEEPRSDAECIALMHSELSEALEYARHGNPQSDHIPEFDGVTEEMADCLIRIFDFAGSRKLKLADALIAKMAFNKGRPYKHGKKF